MTVEQTAEVEQTEEPTEVEQGDNDDGDTFPRAYVETLRAEAKDNRKRAEAAEARADELGRALFTARVAATNRLQDPADLEYSPDLLHDDEALNGAIEDLITKRPHYATRKPTGSVGQGITGKQEQPFSLLDRLKQGV